MSSIDKKPFIVTVLDSLSKDELKSLQALINGSGPGSVSKSLIPQSTKLLTTSDKGIKEVVLEISRDTAQKLYTGYLIYNNAYCVLISYNSKYSQVLTIISMNLSNSGIWSFNIKPCELSISELRSELNDRLLEAGAIDVDGIEVVELSPTSFDPIGGTLTDEQYAKILNDNTLIKLGTQYFYKEFDSLLISYKAFPRSNSQETATIIEYIKIDKSNKSWEEVIEEIGSDFDPSSVEAGELVSALGLNGDGLLKKQALAGLFDGKYVRIMDAPASTTLTDEQIAQINDGVFIKGDFLGYKNPILLPTELTNNIYYGLIISGGRTPNIGVYQIISSLKSIALINDSLQFINLKSIRSVNGKNIPDYPANTDIGQFICRKGTLQYYIPVAQDNITSGDVVALDSNLGKALIDHLEVEINGYRARYEYSDSGSVFYSNKTKSGSNLQVNMIEYNTSTGVITFSQMTFTPDAQI